MKIYDVEPMEEDIIQMIQEDVLNRNMDLVYFYKLLMAQDRAYTIALDGRWGSGKTVFVRQAELVINAKNPNSTMPNEKRKRILERLALNNVSDENYDLAVYYDAWENDHDVDPIISLVYVIAKQLGLEYEFKDFNFFKTAAHIAELISGRNTSGLIESLKSENPIAKFEEQRNLFDKIRQFFNEILVERGERLVLFIDELDRCKPTFAVRLLEQIKHYLQNDRLTIIFSVNIYELQHTVKHYYGNGFDACRYLDRFFSLRIALQSTDKSRFYEKLEMNTGYTVENVALRITKMFHFELREISKFYQQVKIATFIPTHKNERYDFLFPEGKAKLFMLMYIVPLVIGLKIKDISIHDDFIQGKNVSPLIDMFASEEFAHWHLSGFLNADETFTEMQGKKKISQEDILKQIYNAIFVNQYDGRCYSTKIGDYEFDIKSKSFVVSAASMMSIYADYSI